MITRIGIVAGEIWHILERDGKVHLEDIVKKIDSPRDMVLMSVGWLAREGHIIFEGEPPNHIIFLRNK